jgi:xanthine/CO dehydrogenase XdhC/CoxF family maturation factor
VALEGEIDATVGVGFVCGGGVEVAVELPPPPPPQADSRKADRNKTTEKANNLRRWQIVAKHITTGPHSDAQGRKCKAE